MFGWVFLLSTKTYQFGRGRTEKCVSSTAHQKGAEQHPTSRTSARSPGPESHTLGRYVAGSRSSAPVNNLLFSPQNTSLPSKHKPRFEGEVLLVLAVKQDKFLLSLALFDTEHFRMSLFIEPLYW